MLKKTIKYEDFNGDAREEEFFFNLTEAELMEMELSSNGLSSKLQKVVEAQDSGEIIKIVKNLILKSYGVKSEDGRRFIKNDDIVSEFESSAAFSELLMELVTDDEKASAFISGIIPAKLQAEIEKENKSNVVPMNK